jgi:uncharacterized small protein (DUF1192 family)
MASLEEAILFEDPLLEKSSIQDISNRTKLLDNEIKIMKSEQQLQHLTKDAFFMNNRLIKTRSKITLRK